MAVPRYTVIAFMALLRFGVYSIQEGLAGDLMASHRGVRFRLNVRGIPGVYITLIS